MSVSVNDRQTARLIHQHSTKYNRRPTIMDRAI